MHQHGLERPAAPRAVLTPVYFRDPPAFDTDAGPVPPALDALLAPLPAAVARNVKSVVCVPFYSEDGYALARGLQALALQRADLRRYEACAHPLKPAPPDALSEIHVFAIADGWRQADGARILRESMLAEIAHVFGPTLDVAALAALLVRGAGFAEAFSII